MFSTLSLCLRNVQKHVIYAMELVVDHQVGFEVLWCMVKLLVFDYKLQLLEHVLIVCVRL